MTDESLKRGALGVSAVVFLVVSAAAPLNLVAGYGPLGYIVGGIGAPAGFVLAGLVLALFVLGFMAMTRYVDRPGTFYAYIESGLGRRMGLGAAAVALFAYLSIQLSGTGVLSTVAQSLVEHFFGLHLYWAVYAVAFIAIVWYLGHRGIDIGAKVLAVLLLAEVGILTVITVAVLVRGGAHGLSVDSFAPKHVFTGGMAAASVVWFGAFIGIEYTAVYRAETRDPERTMPRAAVISLAFLALFYCLVSWAVVQAFGDANLVGAAGDHPTDMVFVVADRFVGPWAGDVTQVLMVTSSIASSLAAFNTISRYGHAMAHDGILPARLKQVHPIHRSPVAGHYQALFMILGVAFFAVFQLDPYTDMAVWLSTPGVLALILLMALTSVAVVAFFRRRAAQDRPSPVVICASVLSAVLLSIVMFLLIKNIELMTGTTGTINVLSSIAPFAVLLGGIALAWRSKRSVDHEAPLTAPSQDPVAAVPAGEDLP
ncbi:APC family permease [Streptomyces sp. NPDC091215]|uniref:APC family permease n=1 Tax=Streptomyces sp. NPDC091215 TaxID=3155192 RepID=UPI003423379D